MNDTQFVDLIKRLAKLLSKGSSICFHYPCFNGKEASDDVRKVAAGAGEEMKSAYTYEQIVSLLERCGLLLYEHVDHNEMNDRFFSEHNTRNPQDVLHAPEDVCYCFAAKYHQSQSKAFCYRMLFHIKRVPHLRAPWLMI